MKTADRKWSGHSAMARSELEVPYGFAPWTSRFDSGLSSDPRILDAIDIAFCRWRNAVPDVEESELIDALVVNVNECVSNVCPMRASDSLPQSSSPGGAPS